jgi:hypothetical protein
MTYLDDLPTHEAVSALEAQFPGWQFFRGVNGLCYGRLVKSSPQVIQRGEDWDDVRDEVRGWIGRHEG